MCHHDEIRPHALDTSSTYAARLEARVAELEGELDTALDAELKLSELGVDANARAEKAEAKLEALTSRRFPVQGGAAVPWLMVEPHERQMIDNHSQTMERLSQRGGLSCLELIRVLDDRGLRGLFGMEQEAFKRLEREAHDEVERRRVAFERDVIAALNDTHGMKR